MKKHRIGWWILTVLLLALPVAARAQFTFTTNNDTITISGYTGPGGTVTIPDETNGYPVTAIGDYAFFFKNAVTNITIPNSITNIGDYAFAWCGGASNGLACIAIPTNLTRIGNGTFCNCTCLTNVTIPDSVTSIGDDAFAWCYSLNLTNIGKNVVSIGNEAFDSCTGITSLAVPKGVANIGDYAFAWCYSLTDVTISDTVTNIGDYAFAGCGFPNIAIPSGVTNIGALAFYDCGSLTAITVAPENAFYSSLDGVLFNNDQTTLIEYPDALAGSYAIPSSVASIAASAFQDCSLTNVTIPGSVASIGNAAFSGASLASVAIPDGTTNIGDYAFEWCNSLTNVTLGRQIASIGYEAFYGCSILPGLSVDAANTAYCSVGGALFDKGTNVLIQCPQGMAGSLVIPDSVMCIASNALRSCGGLTNLSVGDSVTNIAQDTFSSCSSLSSVTVGGSVGRLGFYAFYYCTNLLSAYFEGNAPSVEFLPFQGDSSVTVYYLLGASGWTNTYAGRPAVLWDPAFPWMTQDIGTVGVAGGAAFSGNVFTLKGGGADINSTSDAFRFAYLPVTGDCTIIARVTSVQNVNASSKAGVMIRAGLSANAANAFIGLTPVNGVVWQYRSSSGGSTTVSTSAGWTAPYWVELVRSGNTFTAYRSSNGTNWTQQGTATFTMTTSAYIGLAITSHNTSSLCTATFDNVIMPGWPTNSSAPLAPMSLNATAGSGQASLSWATSSSATSYNVKRATTNGGPYTTITNVAITSYTDTGLANGTTYYYVVSALNLTGESADSSQASVTPRLGGPTGLSATALAADEVGLSWNAVTGAASYNVKRSMTNGGPYATIATGVLTTNYFDNGLTPGTAYYYVVSGLVDGIETGDSAPASAVTLQLSSPTGLSASALSTNQIGLSWSAVADATSYNLKRSMTNGSGYATIATGVLATNYLDGGLASGTPYYYVVSAMVGGNETPNSVQASAVTLQDTRPTGLSATALATNQISLRWNAVLAATSYNVKRSTTNGGPYALVASSVLTTNYLDNGLAPATPYYYVVSAMVGGVESGDSAQAASVTPQLNGPTGLLATALSTNQINLNWNAVADAASYNVKRSMANGGPYIPVATGVLTTNYLDDGLASGTPYYYVVSAMVGGSETTNSAQASAVTLWSGAGASLVHRYSFSETGGATIADSVGGPAWNGTLPSSGTFSNGQLVLRSQQSQYAALPAGIVSTLSNFTIEVWANLNSVSGGVRLFDFGNNNTSAYMFLTPQSGSTSKLRFGILTPGGSEQDINGPSALSTGVWNHVTVTRNGNTCSIYLNSAPVATNGSMTLKPSGMGNTTNNWLGRSEFSPYPYLNGVLDEFRIYSVALSPAEIAATDALGPSQTLSTGSPPINLAVTNSSLTLSWPLACAGFALQSCTNLASQSWQTVASPAPQIVGGQWQVSLPVSGSPSIFYRLLK